MQVVIVPVKGPFADSLHLKRKGCITIRYPGQGNPTYHLITLIPIEEESSPVAGPGLILGHVQLHIPKTARNHNTLSHISSSMSKSLILGESHFFQIGVPDIMPENRLSPGDRPLIIKQLTRV